MRMKKGRLTGIIFGVIWLVFAALTYYLLLPAINIHSAGLWGYVLGILVLPAIALTLFHRVVYEKEYSNPQKSGFLGLFLLLGALLLVVFLVLQFASSKFFHAKKYASILKTEEYNFTEDLDQATAVSKIALMDTKSAVLLGNREVGSLSEVVSQFNLSADYSQIDLQGAPVKVSALDYAGLFKYFGNKSNGVPGYVTVDPVGQKADYVELEKGMNYVPSAYFSRDLTRYLRFQYPTKIFGNLHFEIDEEGNPFYIASVYEYTVGVFGGKTVSGVIICNPQDGASTYYDVADVPRWVDNAYNGDLIVEQYNWYGKFNNGFWNSLIGKKGCKKTTETRVESDDEDGGDTYAPNFGYVSKDGDIWIYTGVTSVNDDASNIGFILVNERTSESHYYSIAGADENSAMSAAEGEVQEKRYQASFPSLINVDDQPTYVMVLKDASGIVKLYAMVNVESYNIVTTAENLDDCFQQYREKLGTGGEVDSDKTSDEAASNEKAENYEEADIKPMEFTVAAIQYADMNGNTYVYLTAADGNVYKQKFADNERLIFVKIGDTVKGECAQGENGIYTIIGVQ